mmetsp:Transcript_14486/g.32950  ORF Transcript_14486/g.32950 Transcript_14486/m.32950 type:complete len:223 (+) Transcript_14486:1313-1981(+)
MSRPIMSWDTSVSTTSPPTIFTSGSLSMSRTSATTWPARAPNMFLRVSIARSVSASERSASPCEARMTTDLAMWTLTRKRSFMTRGEPDLKTTLVPFRFLMGIWIIRSSSMRSFCSGDRMAMTPPRSDALASQSSSTMWKVFSVQPRISVWPVSMILDFPCLKLSIFSRMMSTVTPRMEAKNRMPDRVMMLLRIRWFLVPTSACVPGSAMKVHADQMPSNNR